MQSSRYDQQDHEGKTPLHWASLRGLDALAHAYVKRGADCFILDNDQRPAAHYACLLSQPNPMLLRSLAKKLDHQTARVAQAALVSAAKSNEALQKAPSSWESAVSKKKARLSYAEAVAGARTRSKGGLGEEAAAGSVLTAGGKGGSTGLHLASSQGAGAGGSGLWREVLPAAGDDLSLAFLRDGSGRTPLHYAAKFGHSGWVARLMALLGKPKLQHRELTSRDVNGWMPLHYAAHSGHANALKLMLGFLAHNADVDFRDLREQTVLFLAAGTARVGVIKPLLAMKADAAAGCNEGYTPLHAAVRTGAHGVCEQLLKAGAPADVASNNGQSPLHLACNQGSLPIVEMLLDLNADVHRVDAEGQSSLHFAAQGGNKRILSRLLLEGVDANAADNRGRTPLHDAAAPTGLSNHGRSEDEELVPMVQQLLQHNANAAVADASGITPLHLSCFEGNLPAVHALLRTGDVIDVNARDINHLTAADYANAVRGDAMVHAIEALAMCKEHGGKLTGAKFKPWKNDSDSELLRQEEADALDEAPSFIFF